MRALYTDVFHLLRIAKEGLVVSCNALKRVFRKVASVATSEAHWQLTSAMVNDRPPETMLDSVTPVVKEPERVAWGSAVMVKNFDAGILDESCSREAGGVNVTDWSDRIS